MLIDLTMTSLTTVSLSLTISCRQTMMYIYIFIDLSIGALIARASSEFKISFWKHFEARSLGNDDNRNLHCQFQSIP